MDIFAAVKHGGGFNSTGAKNWEWFELAEPNGVGGSVTITWRGLGPPPGDIRQRHEHLQLVPLRVRRRQRLRVLAQAPARRLLMRSLVVILLLAGTAAANPRALPFTYTTDTLAPGQVEVEEYADLVPPRAHDPSGTSVNEYLASEFFTELEIGLAERLELGLYFTMVPNPASTTISTNDVTQMPEGNGLKQRLRYTFADPGRVADRHRRLRRGQRERARDRARGQYPAAAPVRASCASPRTCGPSTSSISSASATSSSTRRSARPTRSRASCTSASTAGCAASTRATRRRRCARSRSARRRTSARR